jgi:hypothetical protein
LEKAKRLQGPDMPQAYEAAKQAVYPNWPLAYGREEAPLYNTLQLRDSYFWTYRVFGFSLEKSRRALDYLNVRYLFGNNRFRDFKKIAGTGSPIEISENPTPLPKWFSVKRALVSGYSLEQGFSVVKPMNYSRECFIENASRAGVYNPRQITLKNVSPDRVILTAGGAGKALLVSSETDYPGWRVLTGDGRMSRPGVVENVNHAFRGVVLMRGDTRADFYFEPATFRLGLFWMLLVCGLWAALLLKDYLQREV